jgi:hypothetical protein
MAHPYPWVGLFCLVFNGLVDTTKPNNNDGDEMSELEMLLSIMLILSLLKNINWDVLSLTWSFLIPLVEIMYLLLSVVMIPIVGFVVSYTSIVHNGEWRRGIKQINTFLAELTGLAAYCKRHNIKWKVLIPTMKSGQIRLDARAPQRVEGALRDAQKLSEAIRIAEIAEPHGLQEDVLESYDCYIKDGEPPLKAAEWALYDWDL